MSVHDLLDKLDRVKPNGSNKWMACCPAHADNGPSLSIRETDDGTVLLKCFAGCGAAEIVGAVGLSMRDLFPPKAQAEYNAPQRRAQRANKAMLEAAAHEALIVSMAAMQLRRGVPLTPDDTVRIATAAARLRAYVQEVRR